MHNFIVLVFLIVLSFLASLDAIAAQSSIQVYPLNAVFLSEKTEKNSEFVKSLSAENTSNDRKYAISLFDEIFKNKFTNYSKNINNINKYNTFVAYIQIPRVSQYKVQKTNVLLDLYLPMTMSISFANMVTGEIIYTYTYTYYAKYETTTDKLDNDLVVTNLYKETYKNLLEKVVSTAKDNFKPFAISATIKKEWNGTYILDKGSKQGIVKDDTLIDSQGISISILYASSDYSVAKPILGIPIVGTEFSKFSNEQNIDELKKPKIMLLSGNDVGNVPSQMVYQLFVNALGKNSAFSLISIDKSFYDVQNAVVAETRIGQAITHNRELPEYFLKLYFDGPIYSKLPSTKPDVTYDEYSVKICGDFLDLSGRVLYGKCVDEKITDEIVGGIRYTEDARKEVVVKNSIIKLSDDFIKKVQFKKFDLPVIPVESQQVEIEDKSGILQPQSNATLFKNIGKIEGINSTVHIPTWILSVKERKGNIVVASVDFKTSDTMPIPVKEDIVMIEGMITSSKNNLKRMSFCKNNKPIDSITQDDKLDKLIYYAVIEGIGYPLYDSATFIKSLEPLKSVGYGFKKETILLSSPISEPEYCIELVTKTIVDKQIIEGDNFSNKCNVLAGIKIHFKDSVIWKKALQQNITISTPKESGKEYLDFELNKAICLLMTNISNQIEIK